nr:PREDICTED: putative F-box/FBD/LRR-repeat protein At4g00315 [Nicotiana tabacum]
MSSARNKRQRNHVIVDRISDLPDLILCHILSFLPTHYAVWTSLLSKRWKNLRTNVDTLYFDCFNKKWRKRNFTRFANRVLMYQLFLNKLKKFSLLWTKICDKDDIHAWVRWAIANGVEDFNLQKIGETSRRVNLPISLYSCKTLGVLELRGQLLINCPGNICLPRLKTLSLVTVHYEGDERDVRKLISSCPMLQSLYIERKGYDNVSKFVISSRVLKNLKVKISDDGSFEHVSSLVGANVNLKIPLRCSGEQRDDRVKSIARLMQALHKVEDLHINVPTPSIFAALCLDGWPLVLEGVL